MYKNTKPPADKYPYNTNDKTPELCLFYNLAIDRMNNLISSYENSSFKHLEDITWDKFDGFENDRTYFHLQEYLWKEKVSGQYVTPNQTTKKLIHLFLKKLVDVRNFQSHYYHDGSVLHFPDELHSFILQAFEHAKMNLIEQNPNFSDYFNQLMDDRTQFRKGENIFEDKYPHFKYFKNGLLQEEGKNFFLSFFLLKGEMNRFLKKRNRCKKDNGEKYQVKTRLLTYYCHRDGSNKYFLKAKNDFLDESELLRRQNNTILNYLKSAPVADKKYLPKPEPMRLLSKEQRRKQKDQASVAQTKKTTIRRVDKFMPLAIRYFMDRKQLGHDDTSQIAWQIKVLDWQQRENPELMDEYVEKKSYERKPTYNSVYKLGEVPVIENKHIKFKIDNNDTEYVINEREIKNWLYLLLVKKISLKVTTQLLEDYGLQYKNAMAELVTDHRISFEKYPLVFGGEKEHKVLSSMHESILTNESFDEQAYRTKIKNALSNKIEWSSRFLEEKTYTALSRHKKNRLIIDVYNWFLPNENKLNTNQINIFSKYNYLLESTQLSREIKDEIITPLISKLEKASDDIYKVVMKATSLLDMYKSVLQKFVFVLEHKLSSIETYSLQQLHALAPKLGVSVVGINVSRTEKNRLEELKETILQKPVLISNGLFKRNFLIGEPHSISYLIGKNNSLTSLLVQDLYELKNQNKFINAKDGLKDISQDILNKVSDNYDSYFEKHLQEKNRGFKELVDRFGYSHAADRKQVADAINQHRSLKETKAQDALLAQIFFQYHHAELPLSQREAVYKNIADLFEVEYELKYKNQTIVKIPYRQLDDLSTYWDKKKITQLYENKDYWNEAQLGAFEKNKSKTDLQKVLMMLDIIWKESYCYILVFLKVEQQLIAQKRANRQLQQLEEASKKIIKKGRLRIEPSVVLDGYESISQEEKTEFIEYRNSAFHAGVPVQKGRYNKWAEKLVKLTNVKLAKNDCMQLITK